MTVINITDGTMLESLNNSSNTSFTMAWEAKGYMA